MCESVGDDEPITRYLIPKKHYSPSKKQIKVKAFEPPKNLKLSTYRIAGSSAAEIWEIGDKYVSPFLDDAKGRPFEARADLITGNVRRLGLDVIPEVIDHEGHANITGWPNPPKDPHDDPQWQEARESWAELFQELIDIADLVLRC